MRVTTIIKRETENLVIMAESPVNSNVLGLLRVALTLIFPLMGPDFT